MVKPDAYSAAQELGQAITRAEDAEQQLRERTIELENAHGTINRLNMQLAEERAENLRLRQVDLGPERDAGDGAPQPATAPAPSEAEIEAWRMKSLDLRAEIGIRRGALLTIIEEGLALMRRAAVAWRDAALRAFRRWDDSDNPSPEWARTFAECLDHEIKSAPAGELVEAAEEAVQFIENGQALGYIRMPDHGDTALGTALRLRRAIAKARGVAWEAQAG